MCTLVFHWGGPDGGALVLGANRDEAYDRPSSPPEVLSRNPPILGGRDRRSGGTWLALRALPPRRLLAVLNRPELAGTLATPSTRRSRGLLCLEAARAADSPRVAAEIREQVSVHGSAPFNLLVVEEKEARVWSYDGADLRDSTLTPGLHGLTHGEPDDLSDPRLAAALRVVSESASPAPGSRILLEDMARALRRHGEDGACRHADGYGTVSSTLLDLDWSGGPITWLFADGPPCQVPYAEVKGISAFAAASAPPAPRRE